MSDRASSAAPLLVRDLGRDVPYGKALALQETLHAQRAEDRVPDTLLLLEHAPVYTLGRSAERDHLLWDAATCAERGIAVYESSRGGDITYHGPGQLVGYPIVRLGDRGREVLRYVCLLYTSDAADE